MSSPTSTGPAGTHFEGKVGAHYLLSMLVGAQPRGLPGTAIDRIELQRASQGMYLDDVIVRTHDRAGNAAVLEIQVKRTITFAPKDEVFRSVVEQIAKTASKSDFWSTDYQLAIATSAGSRKIDGAYPGCAYLGPADRRRKDLHGADRPRRLLQRRYAYVRCHIPVASQRFRGAG